MTDGGDGEAGRAPRGRLVVGAAIVDDLVAPRRLLAARRSSPPALAGRWEFPGGKVERGETPEDALRREIREELGVEIDLGPELPGTDTFGAGDHGEVIGRAWPLAPAATDDRLLVLRLWLATVRSGTPRPLEDHDRLRWLEPGEWRDIPWVDADLAVVDALLDDVVRRNRLGWC